MEALKIVDDARAAAAAADNGSKFHAKSKTHTYSDIVQGSSFNPQTLQTCVDGFFTDPATIQIKTASNHHGIPSIAFSISEKLQLVNNLKWVLVGKFSHGKPQLSVIQAFFKNLQLQGDVNCALSDSKHLFIECSCYMDYYWIWMQLVLNIQGYNMRLFKWEPNFSALIESPIAPVWVRIVGLALYLFDERSLLSIASIIGKPIKVDYRNINRSCLSYARVCVELDVSKPLIEEIDIAIVDDETGEVIESKKAQILYDVVPKYCPECSHIGHTSSNCKRNRGSHSLAAAKRVPTALVSSQGRSKQVWQQINVRTAAGVSRQQGEKSSLQGQGHTAPHSARLGLNSSKESAAAGQGLNLRIAERAVEVISTSNGFDSLQIEEKDEAVAAASSALQVEVEGSQLNATLGHMSVTLLQPKDNLAEQLQGTQVDTKAAHLQECLEQLEGTFQGPAAAQSVAQTLQNTTAQTSATDQIGTIEDKVLESPPMLPRTDIVRPKSADSLLGKKRASMQLRALGPCKSIEQKHIKQSWADEVEALDEQEAKASTRMAIEHSFQPIRSSKEGYYKNMLILHVPGFREMSRLEQKEKAASVMAEFYQWKVTSDLEQFVLQEEADSEIGWQVVTHKKKRQSNDNTTPRVQGSKATPPSTSIKGRQGNTVALDPDYNIEQLHDRIQKMKRDSPQKRQLQSELRVLRGA